MATLKHCPFCGSRKSKLGAYEGAGESIHFVICLGCQADGPVRDTEEAAIEAWNHRVARKGDGDGHSDND